MRRRLALCNLRNARPGTLFLQAHSFAGASTSGSKADVPSRPREFHPEPLTDPDLILSHHPARAIDRRLPPSVGCQALPVASWPDPTSMTRPFAPAPLQGLRCYYEAGRPSPAHRYFRPRGWSRLRLFP